MCALLIVPTTNIASAAESHVNNDLNGLRIKLNTLYVTTNYDPAKVTLERKENSKEVAVTVRDKKAREVLNVFGELRQPGVQSRAAGTTTRRVYTDVKKGPVTARLFANVEIYYYDSFKQINKVKNMGWQKISNGNWTLEDTDWWMQNTPGMTVDFRGSAIVTVTTSSNASGNFSINFLENLGFDLTVGSGSTYYARTEISTEFDYSV